MCIACENRTVRKSISALMVTVFLVVRFGIIAISLFTTLSTKENIYILNKYNNLKYFFIAL